MIMAVFLFHHRPNVVVRGGFPPVPVLIVVVGGGYPPPHCEPVQSLRSNSYLYGEGSPLGRGALRYLFRQVFFLKYMGWKSGSSCY
jgi:hypothetical protein